MRRRAFLATLGGIAGILALPSKAPAFIRTTFVKPPFGSVEIDPSAPSGIVDWWLFNEGGGRPQNIAKPQHLFTPNGAAAFMSGVSGLAVNLPGSASDYYKAAAPDDADYIGDITLIWRGVARSTGRFQHFLSKNTTEALNNPFEFRNAFSANLVLSRADAIGASSWQGTLNFIEANVLKTYAVTHVAGSGNAIFYGNHASETIASTARTPTGAGDDIRLGVRTDGVVVADAYCETALIAKRAWTSDQIQAFHNNPYAFVRPTFSRRYFASSPAVTTTVPERTKMGVGL